MCAAHIYFPPPVDHTGDASSSLNMVTTDSLGATTTSTASMEGSTHEGISQLTMAGLQAQLLKQVS